MFSPYIHITHNGTCSIFFASFTENYTFQTTFYRKLNVYSPNIKEKEKKRKIQDQVKNGSKIKNSFILSPLGRREEKEQNTKWEKDGISLAFGIVGLIIEYSNESKSLMN